MATQEGKADSSACECGYYTESGHHVTFNCPIYHEQRQALGNIKEWEDLDRPIWIKEEGEDDWDVVEAFFGFVYRKLFGRHI